MVGWKLTEIKTFLGTPRGRNLMEVNREENSQRSAKKMEVWNAYKSKESDGGRGDYTIPPPSSFKSCDPLGYSGLIQSVSWLMKAIISVSGLPWMAATYSPAHAGCPLDSQSEPIWTASDPVRLHQVQVWSDHPPLSLSLSFLSIAEATHALVPFHVTSPRHLLSLSLCQILQNSHVTAEVVHLTQICGGS